MGTLWISHRSARYDQEEQQPEGNDDVKSSWRLNYLSGASSSSVILSIIAEMRTF